MKKLVCTIFHFSLLIVILLSNSNAPFIRADDLPPYNWTDSSLRGVFMLSTDNVWAVGSGGKIIRWNGATWQTVQSPTGSWLISMLMLNTTNGWAVGADGAIVHWNGTEWSMASSPTASGLYGISIVDSSDGWAVGWAGLIVRWNGAAWNTFSSPTSWLLFSVDMVNSTDGWAVGSSGVIIRWNGTEWNDAASPTSSNLLDVFMVNATEGWAVGADGAILRWNGSNWNNFTSPAMHDLRSVFMVNATNGWAVGDLGTVIRWNGIAWTNVTSPAIQNLFSVHMIADDDGWAVGDFGEIIRWDGIEWTKSTTSIHQGDLIISDDDILVIDGIQFDINGSVIIEENATLILRNASLNFLQTTNNQFNLTLRNPANGNPRLIAYNSTIDSNADLRLTLKGNSTADLNKATIPWRIPCYVEDVSTLSISNSSYVHTLFAESGSSALIIVENSTIHEWQNYGYNTAPEAQVNYSTIDNLLIGSSSINCTISDLHSGLVANWNFIQNCSVASSGGPGGAAPNITLTNTQVGLWRLSFYEGSNVIIIDSPVEASAFGQTRIQLFWYLDVHVVDDVGHDVPSANVTATYPNTTLADSKLTGEDGWTRLTLMEKIKNATGEYPVGIYTIEATYETYSNTTTTEITETQQITLTLEDFIIPNFPQSSFHCYS